MAVVDEAVCKNTSVKTAKRQKSNSIRAFLRWKKFISGVAVAMHMSIFIPCQAKNETFLLTGSGLREVLKSDKGNGFIAGLQ